MRAAIEDRARKYVAAMPEAVAGAGGHDATFAVANVLVNGFCLSTAQALPLLQEYNQRCVPPWKPHELNHKLKSAAGARLAGNRGWLLDAGDTITKHELRKKNLSTNGRESEKKPELPNAAKAKPVFEPERLKKLAGDWAGQVDLLWLANRSAVDPATVCRRRFLQLMYPQATTDGADRGRDKERVLVFTDNRSQGDAVWPLEAIPEHAPDGIWFLAQPVDGQSHANPRSGGFSRRSEEAVREFRYIVLECDDAPVREWLGLVAQLPLAIEAIYTSAGRSVHALARLGCATRAGWDEELRAVKPALAMLGMAGTDLKAVSCVRLTRLPSCWRGRRLQKLLYLRPGAMVRPLIELPPVRDVRETWGAAARAGFSDADEFGGDWLRWALWYYENQAHEFKAERQRLFENEAIEACPDFYGRSINREGAKIAPGRPAQGEFLTENRHREIHGK